MPYKNTLSEVLLMLFTNPPEAFRIICIMIGGAERYGLQGTQGADRQP